MCLNSVRPKKQQKAWIKKQILKDGYIRVYKKVSDYGDGTYSAYYIDTKYKKGLNQCKGVEIWAEDGKKYRASFHFFVNRQRNMSRQISCLVKPVWIDEVGQGWRNELQITAHKAIFPPCPEKIARPKHATLYPLTIYLNGQNGLRKQIGRLTKPRLAML